ncbi:class I SAM-dependent methyltransferase [Mycobacterium colombiense]|uniref:class I SAM-dependent methyltransferase n=1 Tax=Mycobacterium colombiense TaxID=339268 RepID=UPI0018C8B810|nr:class I SAM-dependent methyltransferase [Mycobacterium colombiense]
MNILSGALGFANRVRSTAYRISGSERANYPRQVAVFSSNDDTLNFIRQTDCRVIAEVGIYKGHTSLGLAEFLGGEGELHLFDYEDRVAEVERKIRAAGYSNVRAFGSSYKLLDSYNWSLGKVLEANAEPLYDYVFIDGAHTWAVDALTSFLVDQLLKPGGYIDFDDYEWTLGNSPSLKPSSFPLTGKLYTDEQITAKQVRMVIDLTVRRNPRYREVVSNKIFQKTE